MEAAKEIEEKTLKEMFETHAKFVKCMLDSWALVDIDGKVVKCNPLFSQLVGESSKKILKADNFDSLISLTIREKPVNILSLLENNTPTRIDEINASTGKRSDLTLIMGLYPFITEQGKHLGSFLLIRDVTDDKALHDKYKTTKTDSITDQLTGLYTRRYFETFLETARKNAITSDEKTEMSVIMIDIDHFKQVNDVYGHQAGDAILQNMGELISKTFRKSDVTCRYGGEEFIIILPGTSLEGAAKAANSLRIRVKEYNNSFQGKDIPVTISCGLALFDFENEKPSETIQRADAALYQAKEEGRNQVQVHENGEIKRNDG